MQKKNTTFAPVSYRNRFLHTRKDARVTEWGGLEIRCTACPYRGFESLSFRKARLRFSIVLFLLHARTLVPNNVLDKF